MVETVCGPSLLEFELDGDTGKFLSFRSVSMTTYVEPKKFIGEKIADVLPADTWKKTQEAHDILKKDPKSHPSFLYELNKEQYQAEVSLIKVKTPNGSIREVLKVICKPFN